MMELNKVGDHHSHYSSWEVEMNVANFTTMRQIEKNKFKIIMNLEDNCSQVYT